MCLDIYGLDPVYFVPAPGLAWQTCLKKTEVKWYGIDMVLMIEKEIRGDICQAKHRYAKANNKYKKNYDKTMNHHIQNILNQIICMDGQCLKNQL